MTDVSNAPTASIVIPTRDRPAYLQVALASVAPQAREADAEVLVVDDGEDPATAEIARRHGAQIVRPHGAGLNAARNAGITAARGDLIVLIDDDVEAPPGWLASLLDGIADDAPTATCSADRSALGSRAAGRAPADASRLRSRPSTSARRPRRRQRLGREHGASEAGVRARRGIRRIALGAWR